jgi:hypothetical protein
MTRFGIAAAAVGVGLAAFAHAVDRGTPTDAKAMLAKAAAHYKAVGRTAEVSFVEKMGDDVCGVGAYKG